MTTHATTADAYSLLHRGSLMFSRMSRAGIRVDTEYMARASAELDAEIALLEANLKADEVWRTWQKVHGHKAKLNATKQLADVVFDHMGYARTGDKTEKGEDSSGAAAYRHITDLPFLPTYFRRAKLHKARHTYLAQIARETVDGFVHPSYNMHRAVTFRMSADGPSFQNMPARDQEIMRIIRRCFVARSGRRFVDKDLSGAEVKVGYCNHLDEVMYEYLTDRDTDMHRDAASDLFGLPRDYLVQHAAWAKKTVRDWAKNRYVFPQFYGSVYFQCAPHLWEAVNERDASGNLKHRLPDTGVTVLDHLASQGITKLGPCVPEQPVAPGTFEHRVKRAEQALWTRFSGYSQWKERNWQTYLRTAQVKLLTGFTCEGIFRKNQVSNLPIQGPAAQVIVEAACVMEGWIKKYKAPVDLVGYVHDSLLADVEDSWVEDYLEAAHHAITVTVPKRWPWLVVPLEVEVEASEVDGSWDAKTKWDRSPSGEWKPTK